ncbi:MAG TPA: NAD-dependent epimerase/dehydratase family protein, partial [Vicinamibacterales bacterium]|nr:NAD-dependent epimerase/dehydratase family protein [Vicinamibacterales bacterium]
RIACERRVTFWGTGRPMRELLYVDDLAAACLFLMQQYEGDAHINIGTGVDLSIRDLAEMVRAVVHPDAEVHFDASKPDGSPRKLLDVSHLHALGWRHRVSLAEGIDRTYQWFVEHQDAARMGAAAAT